MGQRQQVLCVISETALGRSRLENFLCRCDARVKLDCRVAAMSMNCAVYYELHDQFKYVTWRPLQLTAYVDH